MAIRVRGLNDEQHAKLERFVSYWNDGREPQARLDGILEAYSRFQPTILAETRRLNDLVELLFAETNMGVYDESGEPEYPEEAED
jgi:hypothetical protein